MRRVLRSALFVRKALALRRVAVVVGRRAVVASTSSE